MGLKQTTHLTNGKFIHIIRLLQFSIFVFTLQLMAEQLNASTALIIQ